MHWESAEIDQGQAIAQAVAEHAAPRQVTARGNLYLVPDQWAELSEGLFPWLGAAEPVSLGYIPVRQIYRLLGFDECSPFRWRLEHKLVQALVLNHFCPGAVPVTRGMYRALSQDVGTETDRERFRIALSSCYVKAALGFGATPDSSRERNHAIESAMKRGVVTPPEKIVDEEFVVQERLAIEEEYRVHTIEDSVVEDTTYARHSGRPTGSERSGPNGYVKEVLSCLPDAFISQTVCGWDVAQTDSGFRIVEVNYSGFHPVACRGFQCSGFLAKPGWGPLVVARLVRFIEKRYGVEVTCQPSANAPEEINAIYWWISRWHDFLRISEDVEEFAASMDKWASTPEMMSSRYHSANALHEVASRLRTTARMID